MYGYTVSGDSVDLPITAAFDGRPRGRSVSLDCKLHMPWTAWLYASRSDILETSPISGLKIYCTFEKIIIISNEGKVSRSWVILIRHCVVMNKGFSSTISIILCMKFDKIVAMDMTGWLAELNTSKLHWISELVVFNMVWCDRCSVNISINHPQS